MATLLGALPTPLSPPGVLAPTSPGAGVAADLFAAALAVLVPEGSAAGDGVSAAAPAVTPAAAPATAPAEPAPAAPVSRPLPEKKPRLDIPDSMVTQFALPILPVPTLTPVAGPPLNEQPAPMTASAPEAKKLPVLELTMTSGGPALGAGLPDQPAVATALAEPRRTTVPDPAKEPVRMGEPAPSAARAAGGEAPPSSASLVPLPQPFAVPTPVVMPPSPTPARAIAAHALAPQLAKPIFTLAAAAPGEHVMTVKVTPENLGPVTVQAHIGADGVRVELFTPTDAGRAAVQAVLPDLRRDLADAGLAASLDLSDHSAPQGSGDRGSDDSGGDDGGRRGRRAARAAVVLGARASPARAAPILASGGAAGLDILA